jgi:hypothetical protein
MIVMTRLVTFGSEGSGGVDGQGLVIVIDFEKDPVPVGIERAKVVFFVQVVSVAKVVRRPRWS